MAGFSLLSLAFLGSAVLAGVVGFALVYVAWQRRETTGAPAFLLFVLGSSAWNVSAVCLWLSPNFQAAAVFRGLTWVCATVALVGWVLFVLAYTDQQDLLSGWKRTLFFIWNGVSGLLYLTTPVTEWVATDLQLSSFQGLTLVSWRLTPLFLVNLVLIYSVFLWSYWLLVQFYASALSGQRRQTLLILVAHALFTVVSAVYYVGGISPNPALDPTPIFFMLTVSLIGFALFFYEFLDAVPLATETLFEETDDPLFVRNETGELISMNDAAATLVDGDAETLADISSGLAGAVAAGESVVSLPTGDGERTFDVQVSLLEDSQGQPRGDLVVLRDISLLKERERELDLMRQVQSRVLRHNIRNEVQKLQASNEVVRDELAEEHQRAVRLSTEAVDSLLATSEKARVVEELVEQDHTQTTVDVAGLLLEAVDRHREVYPAVSFEYTGPEECPVETFPAVGHALRNLVENAAEHNRSSHPRVDVRLERDESAALVEIEDNGPEIAEGEIQVLERGQETSLQHGSGIGLWIAHWVVERAAGDIEFERTETGNLVRLRLPDMMEQ